MPQATAERPATPEEIISAFAKQHGIPPSLAIAVAQKESGITTGAVGDSGKALGMFQLHAGAAADVGVDRSDPFQNIEGGIKYLKQLSDRYNGDVNKVLMAYNGGMGNVDAGTISPSAQAYAAEVMANLSQGLRTSVTAQAGGRGVGRVSGAGPVGRGGPAGPAVGTAGAEPSFGVMDLGKALVEPFDPRTPEGRVNIASTAATGAAAAFTGGAGVVAPWIVRVLGPPVAAAIAGGAERAVEQKIGTTPKEATGPLTTGAQQAAYEFGGQVFMWPLRRLARSWLGRRIGTTAKTGLAAEETATAQAGLDAVTSVRQRAAEHVEAARLIAQTDVAAERARVAPRIEAASEQATARKLALTDQTAAAIDLAKRAASLRVAQTELDAAATVSRVTKLYDAVVQAPPSHETTATLVRNVVSKGTRTEPKGAAQLALDIAGKKVKAAAETGPDVNFSEVQAALESMRKGVQPDELLTGDRGAFPTARQITANRVGAANLAEQAAFEKALAKAQADIAADLVSGVETPPLPRVLGLIQQAPTDQIRFSTAHKLKGLLDEAVNWDATAKGHLERLTKGVRVALRRAMSGHAPYDEATAAYAKLIPLYEDGIGKKIIDAAQHDPDALMKLFDPSKPLQAAEARDLIIKQSAAGGDPAAGQKAWDAVRAAFTQKHLFTGKPEELAERVRTLVTQHPEFTKAVYHDQAGQQILTNAETLGRSITQAMEKAAADVADMTEAGKRAASMAERQAMRTVKTGTTRINTELRRTKAAAAQSVQDVKDAGDVSVRAVTASGKEAVEEAKQAASARNAGVAERKARFEASSLASPRSVTNEAADVVHAVTTAGRSYFGAKAALRLLSGPHADDILEWATFSSRNTQRLAALLMGQLPDRAAAVVLRDMAGVMSPERPAGQPAPAGATP